MVHIHVFGGQLRVQVVGRTLWHGGPNSSKWSKKIFVKKMNLPTIDFLQRMSSECSSSFIAIAIKIRTIDTTLLHK